MTINLRLLLVMFLWAVCFPLITMGIKYSPHLTFAALRAMLSGVSLLVFALIMGHSLPRGFKNWLSLLIIGLGATTFAFFGMFHAAEFVSPGLATVIASTQPLMAALLAHWFIGEKLNGKGKIGLLLGFIGIVLITTPQLAVGSRNAFEIGIAYIIVAALGITVSNVLIKRTAVSLEPSMAMGLQMILGSIPLAIIAMSTEQVTSIRWTGEFVLSLISLSLAGTALAYWMWSKILITVELSYANAFTFLVPIFALMMGIGFYGEQLSVVGSAGILLTLSGIYLVAKGKHSSFGAK